MKPLAWIIFTVMSGPYEGLTVVIRNHCSPAVLEANLNALDRGGLPSMAQCEYGNGPFTSMRPIARPD